MKDAEDLRVASAERVLKFGAWSQSSHDRRSLDCSTTAEQETGAPLCCLP